MDNFALADKTEQKNKNRKNTTAIKTVSLRLDVVDIVL